MSIRPVDFNGSIQRTNDIGTLKQQEDSKPYAQQANIQTEFNKDTRRSLKQVRHSADAEDSRKKFDAREKGSNEYQRQKGQKKDREGTRTVGRVIEKHQTSGFDLKI